MTFYKYTMADGRVSGLFFHTIRKKRFLLTLVNGARVLQQALDNIQTEIHVPYEMIVSIAFEEQLYFHAVALRYREAKNGKVKVTRHAMNSTMVGMVVPLVQNACRALTTSCSLRSLRFVIQRYL